ncbi:amidase [Roseiterribacter gracilis]|uniref:Glutamyl-tRNA amidotransferase subunit A n=1 Tax=Roseiterribacter gracilis TaxID=2812848 RepID=A0A8S8X8W1_9PROT|nr:glutamyl-tRNA amidotransferase subunit A [Rhodospirillales bacterium TMPK1]
MYQLDLRDGLARDTPREWAESCLARTLTLEPKLHAFVTLDEGVTRKAIDTLSSGPLAGVTVGVKDIIDTVDLPTQMGSRLFEGRRANQDAWIVARLKSLGAIVMGKTVTTECAWRTPGATRNPWNLDHTPGGSSSGSAASVAAGCVPVALGSQTLGSMIRPAAFCGVVGFKPSFGAIPRTGVLPVAPSLDHLGLFARSVGDVAQVAPLLFGQNDGDAVPAVPAWYDVKTSDAPVLARVRTARDALVSDAQRALIDEVQRKFEGAGARIVELTLPPEFDAVWEAARAIMAAEAYQVHRDRIAAMPGKAGEALVALVEEGAVVAPAILEASRILQVSLRTRFAALTAGVDAVLTQPAIGEAPNGLGDTGDPVFCTPWTFLGVPAITMPAGVGPNGLPLGLQLATRWGQDVQLLRAAAWCEASLALPRQIALG